MVYVHNHVIHLLLTIFFKTILLFIFFTLSVPYNHLIVNYANYLIIILNMFHIRNLEITNPKIYYSFYFYILTHYVFQIYSLNVNTINYFLLKSNLVLFIFNNAFCVLGESKLVLISNSDILANNSF